MLFILSYKQTVYVLAFIETPCYPRISSNHHLAKTPRSPMIWINAILSLQTEAQKVKGLA